MIGEEPVERLCLLVKGVVAQRGLIIWHAARAGVIAVVELYVVSAESVHPNTLVHVVGGFLPWVQHIEYCRSFSVAVIDGCFDIILLGSRTQELIV